MPRLPSISDIDAALASLETETSSKNPDRRFIKQLSEARHVHDIMKPFREELAALQGFDIAALDGLPELAERAENAEIHWLNERIKHRYPSIHEARDEAIRLRFRLVAAAHRVLPAGSAVLRHLRGFDRRRALPKIVGDLNRLAMIVDEHQALFAAWASLPERPAEAARNLASALAAGSFNEKVLEAREAREQAFATLATAVNEVRAGARFLFRHQPELLRRVSNGVTGQRRQRPKSAKKRLGPGPEAAEH